MVLGVSGLCGGVEASGDASAAGCVRENDARIAK